MLSSIGPKNQLRLQDINIIIIIASSAESSAFVFFDAKDKYYNNQLIYHRVNEDQQTRPTI